MHLMVAPHAMACGHAFCGPCLERWLRRNRVHTCPECRCHATSPARIWTLEAVCDELACTLTKEELDTRTRLKMTWASAGMYGLEAPLPPNPAHEIGDFWHFSTVYTVLAFLLVRSSETQTTKMLWATSMLLGALLIVPTANGLGVRAFLWVQNRVFRHMN
jgi:hypothetical protein